MPRETKVQREAREAKERLEAEHAREAESETDEPAQPPVLPSVVVLVERGEGPNGQIDVDVVAQGDVRATEIETVLKMAVSKWRQKINLPG